MLSSALIVLFTVGLLVILPVLLFRKRVLRTTRRFTLLGLALALGGAALVLISFQSLGVSEARRHWPSVSGDVLQTQVAGQRAFHPEIVYSYSVGGTHFIDTTAMDSPAFGGRNSKYDVAREIVAEFPKGKAVIVYYDPANPSQSTLHPFAPWNLFGRVSLGSILYGGGIFLVAAWFASRRRIPESL